MVEADTVVGSPVRNTEGQHIGKVKQTADQFRGQVIPMTTLSSIGDVLQSLARRNKLHAKITLGMLVILGLFGVRLLNAASSTQHLESLALLVRGGLLMTMLLLLYNLIRKLQKQAEMVVAFIDGIQEQAALERLVGPIGARAETADGPLKDILKLAQRLDKRQRRNFMATAVGLLGAAGIAAIILGRSGVDVERTIALMAVRTQEPEQGASEPERARGLTPQATEERHPPKDEPKPGGERKLQAGGEIQQASRAATQAMQDPRVDPEQLVALRKHVGALQQELSAARQKLHQERQKVALREEGTAAHGSTVAQIGYGTASVVGSAVYFPYKAAFCILGAIRSGFILVAAGPESANKVVSASCRGTWSITPDVVKGKESVHFVGEAPRSPESKEARVE